MEAANTSLLCYCETIWLSRAKMIQRVFELKLEIIIFLDENHRDDSNLFRNDNFIVKLAYFVDIYWEIECFE